MTPTTRSPKTTTLATDAETPTTAASRYQQLRSHLTELKLTAAAEALPSVLDQATAEGLSLTMALERLLAVEVDASTARRLAGRLRFASLPTPATLADVEGVAHAGVEPGPGAQLHLVVGAGGLGAGIDHPAFQGQAG